MLEVAAALYHQRIPSRWLKLAGNSSPPGSWSLSAWLTDLQSRHSHIERVVTQVCILILFLFILDASGSSMLFFYAGRLELCPLLLQQSVNELAEKNSFKICCPRPGCKCCQILYDHIANLTSPNNKGFVINI